MALVPDFLPIHNFIHQKKLFQTYCPSFFKEYLKNTL